MALVLANRVQETTTTTGTGTITLGGAVSGFQSFAAIGDGNTTYYTVTSGTAWEVGIGTYSSLYNALSRTTILSSSAGGAAITLAGISTVFVTYPTEKAIANGYGTLPIANGGTNGTATPTAKGIAYGTGSAFAFTSAGATGQVLTADFAGIPFWATPTTGTVTSVGGTGTVNGITLTGTVTSSGNLTLGGTLSGVSLTTQVSGTLPVANGGTNATATPTAGAVAYGTGSAYAFTTAGTAGQVLVSTGATAPAFGGIDGGTF